MNLGPLQDNGGPTFTMALLPGSPAIDAGDNSDAPDWDQRGPGFPRIVNGIIDIGAFEVQQTSPAKARPAISSFAALPSHPIVVLNETRNLRIDLQPAQEIAFIDRYFTSTTRGKSHGGAARIKDIEPTNDLLSGMADLFGSSAPPLH